MEILNSASLKLEDLVKQAKTVVVVISTSWCAPCNRMAPILEELSNKLVDVKIFKVDVTENVPQFVIDMGVRAVPSIFVYREGVLRDTASGAKSKNELEVLING